MLINLQHYHLPTRLSDAVALLKKNPDTGVPLAGGTYLIASSAREITEVVGLSRLGLSFIKRDQDTLRIGATTTLQEIIDSEATNNLAQGVLAQACQATSVSRMRRNVSTIGGEVAAAALSSGAPVALLALDARLKIADEKEREAPLADFYRGDIRGQLRGAIITEVIIPTPRPEAQAVFLRLAQLPSSIPVIQLAAVMELENNACRSACIAVGAATVRPARLASAEAFLTGRSLDERTMNRAAEEAAALINPISDTRGSAEYRRQMCRVLTRRALITLTHR